MVIYIMIGIYVTDELSESNGHSRHCYRSSNDNIIFDY